MTLVVPGMAGGVCERYVPRVVEALVAVAPEAGREFTYRVFYDAYQARCVEERGTSIAHRSLTILVKLGVLEHVARGVYRRVGGLPVVGKPFGGFPVVERMRAEAEAKAAAEALDPMPEPSALELAWREFRAGLGIEVVELPWEAEADGIVDGRRWG